LYHDTYHDTCIIDTPQHWLKADFYLFIVYQFTANQTKENYFYFSVKCNVIKLSRY